MFQWEKEHLKGVRYNADQYPDDQFIYWGNDWRLVKLCASKNGLTTNLSSAIFLISYFQIFYWYSFRGSRAGQQSMDPGN